MSKPNLKVVAPTPDLDALTKKIREAHGRRTKVDLEEGIAIGRMMTEVLGHGGVVAPRRTSL